MYLNSAALTLPANVYTGKHEKAKIINVEKVRGRARGVALKGGKYPVFGILEPVGAENMKWEAGLSAARYASREAQDGASYGGDGLRGQPPLFESFCLDVVP